MVTYLEDLRSALTAIVAADDRVHLLGEDLRDPYGGAFKVTAGIHAAFPDRVHTTPISEAAIVGVGVGMAMRGLRPIVEIMFGDFLTLAVDQIVNHAAKFPAMYGAATALPLVIRTPMGGHRGYGPTHSQTLEKIVLGTPNLDVIAPSHVHEPGAALATAVECERPVLFIENKSLYAQFLGPVAGLVSECVGRDDDGQDVRVLRNHDGRTDATLVCYGGTSRLAQDALVALQDEEIAVDVVLPLKVSDVPVEAIAASASRSRRVLVVDEATAGFGWAAETRAQVSEALWGRLDVGVRELTAAPTVIPAARHLESEVLPGARRIADAVLDLVGAAA